MRQTVEGSAVAGRDFEAKAGTLTFAPGQLTTESTQGLPGDPTTAVAELTIAKANDQLHAARRVAEGGKANVEC